MNNFFQIYKEQMHLTLKNILKDKYNSKKIDKILDEAINSSNLDLNIRIRNNYKNTVNELELTDLIDKLLKRDIIITGNGVLFKNQNKIKSKIAYLANYILDLRTIDKKLMLKYINTDPELSNVYKNRQLVDKLLANSLFGVMAESNSIFYNLFTAGAITGTGYTIISNVTIAFEKFFNNINFYSFDEFYKYISNQLEDYKKIKKLIKKYEIYANYKTKNLNSKLFSRYIKSFHFNYEKDFNRYKEIMDNLSEEEKLFLYFKNNFYDFIKLPKIKLLLSKLLDSDLLKIDKYLSETEDVLESKELKILKKIWKYTNLFVSDYQIENNIRFKANNMNRKVVLLVDTDSNFLYLDPFFQNIKKMFKENNLDKKKVSITNILTYLLVKYVKEVLKSLVTRMNVTDEYKDEIRMKSEFLFERIILTSNKKHYAGKIIYQEGVIFDKPKIEFKGLQIKKAQVPKTTQIFFKDLIENKFFDKKIKINEILNCILTFQKNIKDDILEGKTLYATNLKLNDKSQYKFPERMVVYRGAKVWNALNPDNPILVGDRCGVYKTTLLTIDDLKILKKTDFEFAKKLFEIIFKDPEIKNYGMNYIAFPKNLKLLPKWLIPFIDIEAIITDNISVGMVLLESLGLQTHKVKTYKYISNIILI